MPARPRRHDRKRVRKRLVFYCPGYDPDGRYPLPPADRHRTSRRSRGASASSGSMGRCERDDAVPAVRWSVSAPATRRLAHRNGLRGAALGRSGRSAISQRGWLISPAAAVRRAGRGAARRGDPKAVSGRTGISPLFVIYPWVGRCWRCSSAALLSGVRDRWPDRLVCRSPAVGKLVLALPIARRAAGRADPHRRKAYVYHLLDGWIFSWQLAAGRRPEFEGRLDAFARRVVAAVRDTTPRKC